MFFIGKLKIVLFVVILDDRFFTVVFLQVRNFKRDLKLLFCLRSEVACQQKQNQIPSSSGAHVYDYFLQITWKYIFLSFDCQSREYTDYNVCV